jgi:catechol 2,3-dioxygenase-like lactoylglutathione lyase family enzyme
VTTRYGQIDHVTMNVRDLARAREFYAAALGTLGLSERTDQYGRVGWGVDGQADFGMYDSANAEGFRHAHIAFLAASRDVVDAFHAAAVAAGGRSLSAPRERPEFGTGYYSAYVVDPEGNGLEAAYRP